MKKIVLFIVYVCGASLLLDFGPFSSPAAAGEYDLGKNLYEEKCQLCHGANGKGDGPASSAFSPGPADFTDPKFWQGDSEKKITESVRNGKGPMPAFSLTPAEIKEIIDYLSHAFKKS